MFSVLIVILFNFAQYIQSIESQLECIVNWFDSWVKCIMDWFKSWAVRIVKRIGLWAECIVNLYELWAECIVSGYLVLPRGLQSLVFTQWSCLMLYYVLVFRLAGSGTHTSAPWRPSDWPRCRSSMTAFTRTQHAHTSSGTTLRSWWVNTQHKTSCRSSLFHTCYVK